MEGYIYLGEYYDVIGRPVALPDKKIGFSTSNENYNVEI